MNFPAWLKPGVYGALTGAAVMAVGGFSWGGWMTGASAQKMAGEMAAKQVIAALVPICLETSRQDAARAATINQLRETAAYRRREIVMAAGWATIPGAEQPNRELAAACVRALDVDAS